MKFESKGAALALLAAIVSGNFTYPTDAQATVVNHLLEAGAVKVDSSTGRISLVVSTVEALKTLGAAEEKKPEEILLAGPGSTVGGGCGKVS